MLKPCEPPVDVVDLQFKLQCRLKIFENKDISQFPNANSLVTCASRYGLLFVGTNSQNFQVIQTQTIQHYGSKEKDDYVKRDIQIPSSPKHLSVNCDSTILAVVVERSQCPTVIFYDVLSFWQQNIKIIKEIRLSSTPNVFIQEINWNPAIPAIFTACKSDGSLGVYELKGESVEFNELPIAATATCFCWSPKGKQIAVGSRDGKITQYKPDLKAVKVIAEPKLEGGCSLIGLQWVSNYQFVGSYHRAQDSTSFIIVVDAPKSGETTFTNYEDICYSGSARLAQFYMILQQNWNFLMVASANSTEVGVLSNTGEAWTQWIMPGSARAELPLSSEKEETLPIGMTFDISSTTPLPWEESTIPPCPLLCVLSHQGVLHCFNVVYLKPGIPSVCTPPDNVKDTSGLSCFVAKKPQTAEIKFGTSQQQIATNEIKFGTSQQQIPTNEIKFGTSQQQTATNEIKFGPSQQQIASNEIKFGTSQQQIPTNEIKFGMAPNPQPVANTPTKNVTFNFTASSQSTPLVPPKTITNVAAKTLFAGQTTLTPIKPKNPSLFAGQTPASQSSMFSALNPTSVPQISTAPVKPIVISAAPAKPVHAAAPRTTLPIKQETQEETDAMMQQMVKDEWMYLEAELRILLKMGSSLKLNVGSDAEKIDMIQQLGSLEEFVKDAVEISVGQSNEIHCLKQNLLQSWAWYEEAISHYNASKNEAVALLIKCQPLDTLSEKRLREIKQLDFYIKSQISQAHKTLDEQWDSFQDYAKKTHKVKIPTMETIFLTMVKQNAILQKQILLLKQISFRLAKTSSDDIGNLTGGFEDLTLNPQQIRQLQYDKVKSYSKNLSQGKSKQLKDLLDKREITKVTAVKPQISSFALNQSPTSRVRQSISMLGANVSPAAKASIAKSLSFAQSPSPKTSETIEKSTPSFGSLLKTGPVISSSQGSAFTPIGASSTSNKITTPSFSFAATTSSKHQAPSSTFSSIFKPETATFSFGSASTTKTVSSTSNQPNKASFSFSTPSTTTNVEVSKTTTKPASGVASIFANLQSVIDNATTTMSSTTTTTQTLFGTITTSTTSAAKPLFGSFTTSESGNLFKPTASNATTFSFKAAPSSSDKPKSAVVDENKTPIKSEPSKIITVSLFDSKSASDQTKPESLFGNNTNNKSLFGNNTNNKPLFGNNTNNKPLFGNLPATGSSTLFSTSPATTTANVFVPATNSQQSSIIGSSGSIFGNKASSTPTSVFGSTKTTVAASSATTATPTAIVAPATTSTPVFSASASVFGTPTTSTSTSIFGTPTTSAPSTFEAPAIFGTPTTSTSTSVFGTPTTSTSTSAFGTPTTSISTSAFGAPTTSTSTSAFGTPTTSTSTSIFGAPTTSTSTSVFGTPTTNISTSVFGTPTTSTSTSAFGTPTTSTSASVFGTSTTSTSTSAFGAPTTSTATSAFGTPTTSTSTSVFGAPTTSTSTSVFGTPATTAPSAFGAPTSSIFGATTTTFGTPSTSSNIFGAPASAGSNIFSSSTAVFGATPSTNIFASPPISSASAFGAPSTNIFSPTTTASIFGASSTTASPFGSQTGPMFGVAPTTTAGGSVFGQPPAFGSQSVFGGAQAATGSSVFGQAAATPAAPAASGNIFGSTATASTNVFGSGFGASPPATTNVFGSPPETAPSSNFGFGGLNVGSSQPSGSLFGSSGATTFGQSPTANPFAKVESTPTAFGSSSSSIFGGGATTSASNIFGSPAATTQSSSIFGGSTTGGGGFGSPSAFGSSTFGQPSTFGSSSFGSPQAAPGPFSGGAATAPGAFGAPPSYPSSSGFGSSGGSMFGGSTFGTSTFGTSSFGQSTFGAPSTFGSPDKGFGGNAATPTAGFGATARQESTIFGNLANQNTIGFGTLAQQAATTPSQMPFSGGASFSSWR